MIFSPLLLNVICTSIEEHGRGLQFLADALLVDVEARDQVLDRRCPRRASIEQKDLFVKVEIFHVTTSNAAEKRMDAFADVIAIVDLRAIGDEISVRTDENQFR